MRLFNILKNLYNSILIVKNNRSYKFIGNVSSTTPLTLTIPTLERGLLYITGSAVSADDIREKTALYAIYSTSGGDVNADGIIFNGTPTYRQMGSVVRNTPLTISIPSSYRGLLHFAATGSDTTRTALYSIASNSSGGVTIQPLVGSSVFSFTTATNSLTISSTSTSIAYACLVGAKERSTYSISVGTNTLTINSTLSSNSYVSYVGMHSDQVTVV